MVKMVKRRSHVESRSLSSCDERRSIQNDETQDEIMRDPYMKVGNDIQYDQEHRNHELESSIDSSIELFERSWTPDDKDHYEGEFVLSDKENAGAMIDRSVLLREIRRMRDGLKNKNWLTEYSSPLADEGHVSPRRKRVTAKRVQLEWLGATVFPVVPYTGKRSKVCQKTKNTSKNRYRSLGLLKHGSQRPMRYALTEPRVRSRKSRLVSGLGNLQSSQASLQERFIKCEPESPPRRSSNLRTAFRSVCDTSIEPPYENTPNSKIEVINLLTPEPNPNPRI